jgi:purine-binding chemotaxis protein CheW
MDFLEIRRKAKERADARSRGVAAAPPVDDRAQPTAELPPSEAPRRADASPDAGPELAATLLPLEDLAQAAVEAGGELTPIPDLPPWGSALGYGADDSGDADRASRAPGTAETPVWNAEVARAPEVPATPLDPLDEFFYREDESAPGLPDLDFAVIDAPAPVEVVDPRREYLTFLLGFEEYAIEIERVREVLKAPAITDVPRAPRHVLGVIMVRGDVIAVFDPRRRLGLPEVDRTTHPRVLVCDDGLGSIGLLVDAVSQVVRLRQSEIEPRPQGVGNVSAEYISGIGRQAGRMFIVLDLPVVLRGKTAGVAGAAP